MFVKSEIPNWQSLIVEARTFKAGGTVFVARKISQGAEIRGQLIE